MSKLIAYIRVSTKEQNLDRQLMEMKALGINDKYIYEDKQSGKDFDRLGYQYMKRALEKSDTLVIKSLDRLGRNQDAIKKEWEWFKDNEINIRVLDMPALNIDYTAPEMQSIFKMISNIVFEVMSWRADEERKTIRQRQAEGIAAAKAKGKKLGRPKFVLPDNFENIYQDWINGKLKAVEAMKLLKMKKDVFYKAVKEVERRK